MENFVDIVNGIEVEPMIINENSTIANKQNGSVWLKYGILTIEGKLNGSLKMEPGTKAIITGTLNGSTTLSPNSEMEIFGKSNGSINIEEDAKVTVQQGGRQAGSASGIGQLIIRGKLGGSISDTVELIVDGGKIVNPEIINGISYYKWTD